MSLVNSDNISDQLSLPVISVIDKRLLTDAGLRGMAGDCLSTSLEDPDVDDDRSAGTGGDLWGTGGDLSGTGSDLSGTGGAGRWLTGMTGCTSTGVGGGGRWWWYSNCSTVDEANESTSVSVAGWRSGNSSSSSSSISGGGGGGGGGGSKDSRIVCDPAVSDTRCVMAGAGSNDCLMVSADASSEMMSTSCWGWLTGRGWLAAAGRAGAGGGGLGLWGTDGWREMSSLSVWNTFNQTKSLFTTEATDEQFSSQK